MIANVFVKALALKYYIALHKVLTLIVTTGNLWSFRDGSPVYSVDSVFPTVL